MTYGTATTVARMIIVAMTVTTMALTKRIVETMTIEGMIVTTIHSAIVNKLNHFSKISAKYVIYPIFNHNLR